ncbi:hypothetical protein ACEPAF_8618 [Sanghuangporus sanghuang]
MPRDHSRSHADSHRRDSHHSGTTRITITTYRVVDRTRQASTPAPAPPPAPAPAPSGSRHHESRRSDPRSTQNASRYVLVDRTRRDPTPALAPAPAPTPALVPQQQQAPQPPPVYPQRTLIERLVPVGENVTYELYSPPLGKGKFGLVLPCKSSERGWIAVKQVRKNESETQLKEIRALQKLRQKAKHANIIQYFAKFSDESYRYYMFELADGGSLYDRMAKTTMSDRECKLTLRQIVNGVSFLHKNACVHCDLKPDNIMFSRPGASEIKIIDFGGSEWLDEYEGQISKIVDISICTPLYMSPEARKFNVIRGVDIWSIGVILWLMFQGLRHYPVQVPRKRASEDDATFRARSEVEYSAEYQKLKDPSTWTKWRGPPGDYSSFIYVNEAMKLCRKMLEPDSYKRILAEEALADEVHTFDSCSAEYHILTSLMTQWLSS